MTDGGDGVMVLTMVMMVVVVMVHVANYKTDS